MGVEVLPDVLGPGLKVVFCGSAVSTKSAKVGAYYAGPRNKFWGVLYRVGLTPRQLVPQEFRTVTAYGIGLTDIVKAKSGPDSVLVPSDRDPERVRKVIVASTPKALAFNGKGSAEHFYGQPVIYGRQPQDLGPTAVFVLPSTSGRADYYWDEAYWRELAEFVAQ
jgi:double-stranded uracil-DNA glycosylase